MWVVHLYFSFSFFLNFLFFIFEIFTFFIIIILCSLLVTNYLEYPFETWLIFYKTFFFFGLTTSIYIYIYNKWVDSGLPTLCFFFFFDKQLSSVILSTIFSQLIWAYHSHHFFLFNNILYLNFIQYIR